MCAISTHIGFRALGLVGIGVLRFEDFGLSVVWFWFQRSGCSVQPYSTQPEPPFVGSLIQGPKYLPILYVGGFLL